MTTDCHVIDELLSPYLDGELGEEASRSVEAHLDECLRCREEIESLRATVAAIGDLPNDAMPDHDLWPGIDDSMEAPVDGVIPIQEQRRRQRFSKPLLWAAAIASLMIPTGATVIGLARDRGPDREDGDTERVEVVIPDIRIPDIRIPEIRIPDVRVRETERRSERLAMGALLPLLDHPQPQVRAEVARALGEFDDPEVIEALSEVLEDDESHAVRRWAAWSLGEIANPTAAEALADALEDDVSSEVRRWAAWGLGEMRATEAVEALTEGFEDEPSPEVRRWSAWALGEIKNAEAVAALSEAVTTDPIPEVRRWSAWALGEIADGRAVEALIRALDGDRSTEVRQWSAWALGEIGDPRARDALLRASRDGDSEVAQFAIRALMELADAER